MNITLSIPPKLAQSLFECQCEVAAVVKDSKNPHFKNSYSSINSVIETLKPALAKSKLFVYQPIVLTEKENYVAIRTIIGHVSGETIEYTAEMKFEGTGPQKMVSAVTYLRRAQLVSLFFLPQEDDDGNSASALPPKPQQSAASQAIQTAAVGNGWTAADVAKVIHKLYGADSLEKLGRREQEETFKIVSTTKPTEALK